MGWTLTLPNFWKEQKQKNPRDGIGPLYYAHDASVGDADRKAVGFQNAIHIFASDYESILCNGHRVVDRIIGELIPFRVVIVRMEDLTFRPPGGLQQICGIWF